MTKPECMLWLDGSRGVYIPQNFAECFADRDAAVSGVDAETWTILEAGPDHELYWEAWDDVLRDAIVTADDVKYALYQDDDLWLVPEGMEWSDSNGFFVWPDEEETENE